MSGSETKPVESIGGPGFQSETVGRLSQTASAQIESQVLVPIKRWLDVFNALHGRMKEVEALRLEVDSRRHTVIDLAASVDKLRAKLGKVGGHDAKLEASLDDTIKKLQHKEGKLTCTLFFYPVPQVLFKYCGYISMKCEHDRLCMLLQCLSSRSKRRNSLYTQTCQR